MINIFIGDKIRSLRIKNKISQKDLGQIIGRPQNSISQIESGSMPLDPDALDKLAKYFNVPISYFYNENDAKTNIEVNNESLTMTLLNKLIENGTIKDANDIKEKVLNAVIETLVLDADLMLKKKDK